MLNWIEKVLEQWKKSWGILILFLVGGSIVGLFIASFCFDKQITLSTMNEWVSLVVGMVALILGIISLFLSFYNVEQSNKVQQDTKQIMTEIRDDIKDNLEDTKNEILLHLELLPNKTAKEIKYEINNPPFQIGDEGGESHGRQNLREHYFL